MKRLRATIDIYVDIELIEGHEDMTEDEQVLAAKDEINQIVDSNNFDYNYTDTPVSMSEIYQFEIYEEKV